MPATHQRKLIRDQVVTQLLNKTAAGTRVKSTRRTPHRFADLPGIGVYTLIEPVDPESRKSAPRELKRQLQLAIVATQKGTAETIDDLLDTLAAEIEIAIAADETLGGKCADCVLASTEFDFDEQAEQEIGGVRLIYDVTYYRGAPESEDVTVVDLKTVDTKVTDLDGGADIHPSNQAEDKLQNLDL